ncbi:MAG: glycosyltransferase family 9 protein [Nanoarchaeota archaeon]
MKILFIKLGALGGVLRGTPLFTGLKKKYPKCELNVITQEYSSTLLQNNPDIDKLLIWEKDRNKIREISFDWIINTEDDKKTCEFATALKTKKFTGPYTSKTGKITYTKDVAIWYDMGKISRFGLKKANELKKKNSKRYQEIYSRILDLPINNYPLVLNMTEKEKRLSREFRKRNEIAEKHFLIGVNTGAGVNWPLKALSIEKTVELIKDLHKKNLSVVLLGGPNETERNREILKRLKVRLVKNSVQNTIRKLFSKALSFENIIKNTKFDLKLINPGTENPLRKFISIINALDILITSDTLTLHIAAALKKRIVCFFGPTSAEEIELYGQGVKIKPSSECYCCFQKERTNAKMCIDEIRTKDLIESALNQTRYL